MTRTEFVEVCEFIEAWWGPSAAWESAPELVESFEALDYDRTIDLLEMRTKTPAVARFAPKPAELRASVLASMQSSRTALPVPPVPEPPDGFPTWGAWALKGTRWERPLT